MANARLMKVELDNIDVSAYVRSWKIKRDFGNSVDSMELEFVKSIEDVVTVSENGQTLEAWFGTVTATDKKYFNGYIEKFRTGTGTYECTAYSVAHSAVREMIGYQLYDPTVSGNPVEPDGKYSDAFIDIVTTYAGLSADSSTVDDTGTDPAKVIKKLVCFETDPKERMDKIAEAFQKIWYYRADTDKVYLRSPNSNVNTTILEVGVNVQGIPEWEYTKDYLINDLRIRGVYQERSIDETFSGTGSTQEFTLTYPPLGEAQLWYSAAKNYSTTSSPLANEQKVLGVDQSTSTSYDFTVDKAKKKISTVGGNGGGFTAAAGTNNILVRYTALVEIPVRIVDDISVTANRRYARRMTLKDTLTVQDVIARTTQIVEKFKNPFKSSSLKVPWADGQTFELGDSIKVIHSTAPKPIDEFLTIWGITYQWPDGHDIIKVGDREFQEAEYFLNTNERLAALESEVFDENAIYTEVRSGTAEIQLEPGTFTVDFVMANDSFILGLDDNCKLYGSAEAFLMDGFEVLGNWSQGPSSITVNLTNDSTAGHFWVGTQGINVSWTGTGFTGVQNVNAMPSFTTVTGVATGNPSRGTIGVWVYTTTPSSIADFALFIGNDVSNYRIYSGQQYSWKVLGLESSFALQNGVRTLVLFDLDGSSINVGTVDWAAIDSVLLAWTSTAAGNLTLDYLTASRSNIISMNGLGDRRTTFRTDTYAF